MVCNGANPMIEAMLPSYNIYNGFGTGWGWPNLLRLDRVLVQGNGLNSNEVNARLFSNRPVYECTKHTDDDEVTVWKDYLPRPTIMALCSTSLFRQGE